MCTFIYLSAPQDISASNWVENALNQMLKSTSIWQIEIWISERTVKQMDFAFDMCRDILHLFFRKVKLQVESDKRMFLQWVFPYLSFLLVFLLSESQTVMPGTRCKNAGCKTVSVYSLFLHVCVCVCVCVWRRLLWPEIVDYLTSAKADKFIITHTRARTHAHAHTHARTHTHTHTEATQSCTCVIKLIKSSI